MLVQHLDRGLLHLGLRPRDRVLGQLLLTLDLDLAQGLVDVPAPKGGVELIYSLCLLYLRLAQIVALCPFFTLPENPASCTPLSLFTFSFH